MPRRPQKPNRRASSSPAPSASPPREFRLPESTTPALPAVEDFAALDMPAGLLKTLTANEEKIVHELFKHKKDGLTQKGLARETGIPKSTLSRTLKRLAVKSVVEIKDYGVTKKIRLTEWFLKK